MPTGGAQLLGELTALRDPPAADSPRAGLGNSWFPTPWGAAQRIMALL